MLHIYNTLPYSTWVIATPQAHHIHSFNKCLVSTSEMSALCHALGTQQGRETWPGLRDLSRIFSSTFLSIASLWLTPTHLSWPSSHSTSLLTPSHHIPEEKEVFPKLYSHGTLYASLLHHPSHCVRSVCWACLLESTMNTSESGNVYFTTRSNST